MSIPGHEIHRSYDDWGPVRVFEDGPRRYLAFESDAEQSCIDLSDPATLIYQYTQAMMLALLFQPTPERATLLGLGAGSLVHTLRHYDPALLLDVVEIRPLVAEVARQWFGLTPSASVSVYLQDACDYMAGTPAAGSDLIFADIYNDQGMIEAQLDDQFLLHCYNNLSDDGVLVLNLWQEGRGLPPQAVQALWNLFGDNCLSCTVHEGNLIAFAFKGGVPQYSPRRLQPQVKKLSRRLNLPLHKLVDRLRPV